MKDQRRADLEISITLHAEAGHRDAQQPADHREPASRAAERRRCQETRPRRRAFLSGRHREGLHLVAQGVGDSPIGQQHAQPKAGAGPAIQGEGLAAMGGVNDAIAHPCARA